MILRETEPTAYMCVCARAYTCSCVHKEICYTGLAPETTEAERLKQTHDVRAAGPEA